MVSKTVSEQLVSVINGYIYFTNFFLPLGYGPQLGARQRGCGSVR